MTIAEFVKKHPPRPPARPPAHPDELRRLGEADGVRRLEIPLPDVPHRRVPAKKGDVGCHLWVLDESGVPFILELARIAPPLASGRVKHTNLTGGAPAACGGEVWFDPVDAMLLYVNGCSGRYGPKTVEQLDDAVEAIRGLGFLAESFGWDWDTNKPAMVLRK